jgi:hypothetical protein
VDETAKHCIGDGRADRISHQRPERSHIAVYVTGAILLAAVVTGATLPAGRMA